MARLIFMFAALALQSAAADAQPARQQGSGDTHGAVLAAFGLTPVDRQAEVIRYTVSTLEFAAGRATGTRHVVIQIAPARDVRSAALTVVTGRGALRAPPRVVTRREETISIEEYRSMRLQLVRLATNLNMREQEVSNSFELCSHAPWSRFDIKLGGESNMSLIRTGGCDQDATAYRAGEFLLIAAERILGQRIEGARPGAAR
jgi:hypothetical protein